MREDMSEGVFKVDDGKRAFLAHAYTYGRYRFDPGCMTPQDSRARRAALHFDSAREAAEQFEWDTPNKVLVINNRRVLHARSDAKDHPDRELKRLAFLIKSEARP
ncbi:hypothetical protein GCM10027079_22940 [Sediminivirga luteola]|uniref:TfdA family taurine catabolism dioxygenase TauD n=1 Tax=Sediminivirga luteola TaxID=1774748 RepID=A0A8J2U1L2_9MICO|nr:hypothetical protein GCM10011333_34590 [Sediminivirga luteola]